jgi:hypothetical protein
VLGNREIRALSGFRHDQVAAHLSSDLPPGAAKCLSRFFAGDVAELPNEVSSNAL